MTVAARIACYAANIMIIGVPKEVKDQEARVGLLPSGAKALVEAGHQVLVQTMAGKGSSLPDAEYHEAGATIVATAADVWTKSDLVIKVKEPQHSEYDFLRPGLVLFTYLHLAPLPELTERLLEAKVNAVAYETIREKDNSLPLLTPMSEVAGRMAVQVGAQYLEAPMGGRGILLGGVPGVAPANVVILGGGVVGHNAAKMAVGLGAHVTVIDRSLDRLRESGRHLLQPDCDPGFEHLHHSRIAAAGRPGGGCGADSGRRSPEAGAREMIGIMKKGSVMVDVAIDQGGCFETSHATTHTDPIYFVDGVLHYCVSNMPAAVPHTSTFALNNATFPYLMELVHHGLEGGLQKERGHSRKA